MFCRKCGATIQEDSQFCQKCGAAVATPWVISASSAAAVSPACEPLSLEISSTVPASRAEHTISSQRNPQALLALGVLALLLWTLHGLWYYGLFFTVLDVRLWLLAIPIYLLYRRFRGTTKPGVAQEPKPEKAGASRWARLGIFLCVALASAILAAVVFVKGSPTFVEGLTAKLTEASLQLGLAAWVVSEIIARRWLTLKRTWIAAIALYSVAFILTTIFLGKPVVTKLAELNKEQAQLDRRFAETATGKAWLQPQSFASPQVAATWLAEFQQYADSTEALNKQKEALLLQRDDPSSRDRWETYFGDARAAATATEELYSFAAEPSRQVHVENGVVIIADPEGYNKRIDAANDAMGKLRLAATALGHSQN